MGKSVLAANALEHILSTRPVDEKHGIVFMYYDYKKSEEQDLAHVIRALLKQLCRDRAKPPEHLHRLKKESRHVGNQDDILVVVKEYAELYIVVDAFDECRKIHRSKMIGMFKAVMDLSTNVKILLTSRHETDISDGINGKGMQRLALESSSNKSDIDAFITREIETLRAGGNMTRLRIDSDDLVEELIKHLREKSNGLYVPTLPNISFP